MKSVPFVGSLSRYERKHPFEKPVTEWKRKNDANQLVKEQKRVISIKDFHPLDFGYILTELIGNFELAQAGREKVT